MGLEWQGWKLEWPLGDLLIPSFLVQSSHYKAIPVIPMGWGPISFQAHSIWEWLQNEIYLILRSLLLGMSLEWKIFRLQDFCHLMTRNDTRLMEWHNNDWNEISMMEWYRIEFWMKEWHKNDVIIWNDGMTWEWRNNNEIRWEWGNDIKTNLEWWKDSRMMNWC